MEAQEAQVRHPPSRDHQLHMLVEVVVDQLVELLELVVLVEEAQER